jgi:CBS domain containing-hemolysin-like protein
MPLIIGLPLALFLIAANGFFVAVEFALVAADRQRLESLAADGRLSARAALSARRRLSFHLSGAQLGITVTSLVVGFLSESIVSRLLAPVIEPFPALSGPTASVILALSVATVFQMLFGELIPKTIAVAKPEPTARVLAPVAIVVHGILSPIIRLLNGAANLTVRLLGMEPQEELEDVRTLEELEYIIQESGESGALKPAARAILARTLRFGDKTAADALTPRVHVAAVGAGDPVAELLSLARHHRFSRYPVYGRDHDDVQGIVDVTAVFALDPGLRETATVGSLMVDPLVVPETRDLIDIIEDFRQANRQMAVVIDEHGGTAGILTVEDVLEEILGEVDDEDEQQPETAERLHPGEHVLVGTLHPDEVEEACGLALPDGEYETLAGFILSVLGHIPERGDSVLHQSWRLEVGQMDGLRIAEVRLVPPAVPSTLAPGRPEST